MYKVKSNIKENGKLYKKGDTYQGERHDELLNVGAIYKVEEQKKVTKKVKKKTAKKKTSKQVE